MGVRVRVELAVNDQLRSKRVGVHHAHVQQLLRPRRLAIANKHAHAVGAKRHGSAAVIIEVLAPGAQDDGLVLFVGMDHVVAGDRQHRLEAARRGKGIAGIPAVFAVGGKARAKRVFIARPEMRHIIAQGTTVLVLAVIALYFHRKRIRAVDVMVALPVEQHDLLRLVRLAEVRIGRVRCGRGFRRRAGRGRWPRRRRRLDGKQSLGGTANGGQGKRKDEAENQRDHAEQQAGELPFHAPKQHGQYQQRGKQRAYTCDGRRVLF